MCVQCYYPPVPLPRGENKEKYIIGYKFYDGYVFQKYDGTRILETTTDWWIKKKINKLIDKGYKIHWPFRDEPK